MKVTHLYETADGSLFDNFHYPITLKPFEINKIEIFF